MISLSSQWQGISSTLISPAFILWHVVGYAWSFWFCLVVVCKGLKLQFWGPLGEELPVNTADAYGSFFWSYVLLTCPHFCPMIWEYIIGHYQAKLQKTPGRAGEYCYAGSVVGRTETLSGQMTWWRSQSKTLTETQISLWSSCLEFIH